MYKALIKTNIEDEVNYANLKTEFTNYKKILRRSINEAKRQYYWRTFELYKNIIKQTWSVIKNTLQKMFDVQTLRNLFSTTISLRI